MASKERKRHFKRFPRGKGVKANVLLHNTNHCCDDETSTGNAKAESDQKQQATVSCEMNRIKKTTNLKGKSTGGLVSKERPFQCSQCNRAYRHRENLTRHCRNMHSKLFQCTECSLANLKGKSTGGLVSKERPFQCSQCNRAYRHRQNLTRHCRNMHSKTFQCTECSLGYSKESTLIRHYKMCHALKLKCSLCSKAYNQKNSLIKHCRTKHRGLGYHGDVMETCSVCGIVYYRKGQLFNHCRSCHQGRGCNIMMDMFQCSECGNCYGCKRSLVRHSRKHNGHGNDHATTEKVQCSECGQLFTWRKNLVRHCHNKHSGLGCAPQSTGHHTQENTTGKKKPQYPCSCCDLTFHSLESYKTHLFTHSSKTAILLCAVCDKTYHSVAKLWRHQRTTHCDYRHKQLLHKCKGSRARQKPFATHHLIQFKKTQPSKKCTHCNKTFKSASALYNHPCDKRSSKDLSPDKTNMFPKSKKVDTQTPAMSLDPVVVPLNTASGRGYKCALCGKVLTRMLGFREHMNLHTGARPYVCEVCSMAFSHATTKSTHMKKHKNSSTNSSPC